MKISNVQSNDAGDYGGKTFLKGDMEGTVIPVPWSGCNPTLQARFKFQYSSEFFNRVSAVFALIFAALIAKAEYTQELEQVPVLADVEVCVVGGSVDAVAAACTAADKGARVFLVTDRPYLGDDLCGSQKLWLEEGEEVSSEIGKALFPAGRVTTPLTVKAALDQQLAKRGIAYLTGSYTSDILLNDQKDQAGILMINRSGTQAVRAKTVLDFRTRTVNEKSGSHTFSFIVVGGDLQSCPVSIQGKKIDVEFKNPGDTPKNRGYPVYHYTTTMEWDRTFSSLAKAEQAMRDAVSGIGMVDCSEMLLESRSSLETRITSGEAAGLAAVACQRARPKSSALTVVNPLGRGFEEKVPVYGARNTTLPKTTYDPLKKVSRQFPVLGTYDVVVVGGGTSGSAAGIGAARQGAKTLVIEYLDELGGVGTAGLIGVYWYGIREGFTKEMDQAILEKQNRWPDTKGNGFNVIQRAEWLRRELRKAGGDTWFRSFGCGVAMRKGKVCGVLVATPMGVGVVETKTVIDATGNADLADAAGAPTVFGVEPKSGQLSVQLAGCPRRNLGDSVVNTCFALVDDTSVLDLWHLMFTQRLALAEVKKNYDAGQLVDSRERRRVEAEYMVSAPDILAGRRYPDTISHHRSNFDASAFPTCPMLWIKDMKGPVYTADMPLRSLLPKKVEGLLVTGLGAGAERDAMTLLRMQPDLQNQGYAAGVAAAMAAQDTGGELRKVDIRRLQKRLVERSVLQERVLTDSDNYPVSGAELEKAVRQLAEMKDEIRQQRTVDDPSIYALGRVMLQTNQALPLLREAYSNSSDLSAKRVYARVLGVLGDPAGAKTLCEDLAASKSWDKGFGLTSHRETGNTFSRVDRLVIALGMTASPEAYPALEPLLKQLTPAMEMSHVFALAIALRFLGYPKEAVSHLEKLLEEQTSGAPSSDKLTHQDEIPMLSKRAYATDKADGPINRTMRECIAAGVIYQCDPKHLRAQAVLEKYAKGVEGHYVRYAKMQLCAKH